MRKFIISSVLLWLWACVGCGTTTQVNVSDPTVADVADAEKPLAHFLAFGDSRLPGYMRFTKDQESEIAAFVKANWQIESDYQTKFDDVGNLAEIYWPTETPQKRFTFKGGWPHRVWHTDSDPALVLRSEGQQWVYQSIVSRTTDDIFIVHTGDIVYNGYYGTTVETSPYWEDFQTRFLARLPSTPPRGLPGRFFPAVGNHETWLDSDLQGLLTTLPYLSGLNLSKNNHMYHFTHQNCLFVFLDTGAYPPKDGWGESAPDFDTQQAALKELLVQAETDNLRAVFVVLHKPPFCCVGHGHLIPPQTPHPTLSEHSEKLDITVFSGHVHSTEMYFKNNIKYFVLGGGGADQTFKPLPCEESDPYCHGELYWSGEKRQEEYNYLEVKIFSGNTTYQLTRWRPENPVPYEKCEITPAATTLNIDCKKSSSPG